MHREPSPSRPSREWPREGARAGWRDANISKGGQGGTTKMQARGGGGGRPGKAERAVDSTAAQDNKAKQDTGYVYANLPQQS